MTNLKYITDVALSNPNVAAFLHVIRACEGTAGENGYQMLFGGSLFYGYVDHPRKVIETSGYKSSAAGAYQFLSGTWDDYVQAVGPSDFSPESQDRGAVWLIYRRGALDDVLAGRLDTAIAKCNKEWASLPGSPYGQPTRTLEYCHEVYNRSGGQFESIPAPIEERSRPLPPKEAPVGVAIPLLAQLIPQVLALFSGRAQAQIAKATGASPDVAAQFMQSLMGQIGQAVGVPVVDNATAVQAVAAITQKADPVVVKSLEEQSLDYFERLAPLLDKLASYDQQTWGAEIESQNAAAARFPDTTDFAKPLVYGVMIMCALLITLVGGIVTTQVVLSVDHVAETASWAALTGIIGTTFGILGTIYAFRFGTSRNSSAKDMVIATQAATAAKR